MKNNILKISVYIIAFLIAVLEIKYIIKMAIFSENYIMSIFNLIAVLLLILVAVINIDDFI